MTDTNTTESTIRKDNMTADHINHADRTDNGEHAIIAVEHVTFGYKKRQTVLEDIDFTVPQGQSLAILGYNGVGKTTLFRLIVGLLRPREGRCVIDRRRVPSMRDVFQMTENGNLVGTMTVRDNIHFRQLLFRSGKGIADGGHTVDSKRLENEPLVRAFELEGHLDKKVAELSTGLRKRVGIVAGMLFDPHVIMLDEPSNAIDPITRSLLVDYVNQLRADERTLLTVTHDLEYCWNVADRIIILDDKHLVKDMMLAEFDDYEAFTKASTLGRDRTHVDFGLPARGRQA